MAKPHGIPTKGPRLKRYLADPGLRSRLPDRALPPALLARRRANARNAALDDPNALTAPMTPRTLRDAVNASTRLKFAPQEQQVGTQLVQTDAQSQRIKDFYKNYLDDLQGIQAQQSAAYQQAQSDIAARAQSAYSAASGQAQQVDNAMQADAQLRGTTAAPDTAARQSAAVRLGLGTSLADQLLSQGVHQQDFMGALRASGGGRQIQEQLSNLAQRRALQGQLTTLKGQKGDYAAQLRQQLVGEAQKYGLEQAAFGLNQQKVAASAAEAAARVQTTRRGQTLSHKDRVAARQQAKAQDDYDRAHHLGKYKPSSKGGAGGSGGRGGKPRSGLGSLTQGQENTGLASLDEAVTWFKRYKGKAPGATIRQYLLTGATSGKTKLPKIDRLFVNAAEDIVYRGGLSRTNIKRLRDAGYHVKNYPRVKVPGRTPGVAGPPPRS